ncbi:hypothetical protein M3Y94_00101200 [Aphelenchoides besseyi]|nr:hypothetical protein M3Y94_00101200 [Aphelenchoides besseyi]KAI6237590.1 hypothetical protein M3Y95_00281400 [Aphelenchoides besseyi]
MKRLSLSFISVVFFVEISSIFAAFDNNPLIVGNRRSEQAPIIPQKPAGPDNQEQCRDIATNCLQNSFYCNDVFYRSLMEKTCAKTCGYCIPDSENENDTGRCLDQHPQCFYFVRNGFCESEFYPTEVKKRYCRLSCRLCDEDKPKRNEDDGRNVNEENEEKETTDSVVTPMPNLTTVDSENDEQQTSDEKSSNRKTKD